MLYEDFFNQLSKDEQDLQMSHVSLNRLLYLAAQTRVEFPSTIARYVPYSDALLGIARYGIDGYASSKTNSNATQIHQMCAQGDTGYPATDVEYKELLGNVAIYNLSEEFRRNKLAPREFADKIQQIKGFMEQGELLGVGGDIDFNDTLEVVHGFYTDTKVPLISQLVGDLSDGVYLFAGRPATGKTTILLGMGLQMLEAGVIDELLFMENELTRDMMTMRAIPAKQEFDIAGKKAVIKIKPFNMTEDLQYFKDNPNPNRLVIYDSPDVYARSLPYDRRFSYEFIMATMAQMREALVKGQPVKLNKYIWASSQLNRMVTGKPKQEHLTESDFKAHYADGIFAVWRDDVEDVLGDVQALHATCLKIRNGSIVSPNNVVTVAQNFRTARQKAIGQKVTVVSDDEAY